MSGSEIARILQQIRDDEEAARRAFYDFAMVGRHDFINAKMGNMDQHVDALGEILGSRDEAMKLVIADQMQSMESMEPVTQQAVKQERT
jgi:hypothetical protein